MIFCSVEGNLYGLDLGTTLGGNEVIAGGVTDLIWTQNLRAYYSVMDVLDLYIRNTGARLVVKSIVASSPVANHSMVCLPYMRGIADGETVPRNSTWIQIFHNCTGSGLAFINLDMSFGIFDAISIGWGIGKGNFRNGFSIGSRPNFSDVVLNSIPLPLWNPLTSSRRFGPYVDNTTFQIYNTNGTQEFTPKVVLTPSDLVEINVTGTGANGGTATEKPLDIDIAFTCLQIGVVNVDIIFELKGYEDVRISFRKECMVVDTNFNLGTQNSWDDIVSRGKTTLMWSSTIHTALILDDVIKSPFWIFTTDGSNQTIESYSVNSSLPECNPYIEGNLTTVTSPSIFNVVYDCNTSVRTEITVTIILSRKYRPVVFSWTKIVKLNDDGLIVGVRPGGREVIYDGKIMPAYHPKLYSAFVLGSVPDITFYVGLSKPDNILIVQNISVFAEAPNQGACIPYITGDIASGGILAYDSSKPFTVNFNCVGEGKTVMVVNVFIKNQLDLIFKFVKRVGGPREYFTVGSQPAWSDVVLGGVPLPLWNDQIGGFRVYSGEVDEILFYLHMDHDNVTQAFLAPVMNVHPVEVLTPTIAPPTSMGGILRSNITVMNITFHCHLPQSAEVSVVVGVVPFKEVQWTFKKICGIPKIGFSIGLSATDYNVAVNGAPTLKWSNLGASHVVANETLATTFFIKSIGRQEISQISIQADSHCSPYLIGNVTEATHIPQELTVVYNCTSLGTSMVNMNITLTGILLPLQLYWGKMIGGYRNGLMIGNVPDTSNVVNNGQILPGWKPNSPNMTVIGAYDNQISFHCYLVKTNNTFEQVQDVSSLTIDFSPNVFWLEIEKNITQISQEEQFISVNYTCLEPVDSHVTTEIDFLNFESIRFEYIKRCPPAKEHFMVGTTPDHADVVVNGIFTEKWSLMNHTYVVEGNIFFTSFWVWIESDETIELNPQVFCPEEDCSFTLSSLNPITRDPQEISIQYHCLTPGSAEVTLSLGMDLFSSAAFRWTKKIGGIREGFNIGTSPHLADVTLNGVVTPTWMSGEKSLGQWVWTQTFYLWLGNETTYQIQSFGAPVIYSSICSYSIEGPGNSSNIATSSSDMFFVIFFNCKNSGTEIFSLDLHIPPFEPLEIKWKKEANGYHLGIDVFSKEDPYLGGTSVITNGQVESNWQIVSGNYSNTAFLKETNITFIIKLEELEHLPSPAEQVDIGTPYISALQDGCEIIVYGTGGILSASKNIEFILESTCTTTNKIGVAVTIPVTGFRNFTFDFSLETPDPVKPSYGPFILLGGLMTVLLIIVVSVLCCLVRKKKNEVSSPFLADVDDSLFGDTPSGFD